TYWGADAARQAMGSYSILTATIAEVIGTAVLLWGILGAFDSKNLGVGANLGPLFVGFAVLAVGVSLGGASGYAINPARDLAPRIFAALIGSKEVFDGTYWFIAPIIGPFTSCPVVYLPIRNEGVPCQLPQGLKAPSLCLSPKAVHHRPIDCGPAASHEAMAAMDALTVNILPGSGLSARTPRMLNVNVQ